MESCQQQKTPNSPSNERQEIDLTNEQWSNSAFTHNIEIKEDETENIRDPYECDGAYVNVESQDIFAMSNSRRNSFGQIENNFDMTDSVGSLCDMGKYCLDLNADISQKLNDIQMLEGHTKSMKINIEEKQKYLETLKVALLTEQDNYDDIQKKLNDEIELITATGLQQEALNSQTKTFLRQKHKVEQLLEDFKTEFYANKINAEKILHMFQERFNRLESIMQDASRIKNEIDIKKMHFLKNKLSVEENLKSKTTEMERMQGNLKVKYYQQVAILEYLKIKGNEEYAKCSEFNSELKSIDENEHQQIHLEEDECVKLEEKLKLTSTELSELQSTISEDKIKLNETVHEKKNLHEQVGKLLQKEAAKVQECSTLVEVLSEIITETDMLTNTLNSKTTVVEENINLKTRLEDLEIEKNNILGKQSDCDNSKMEASKKCLNLETHLQAITEEQLLINEKLNNLNLIKTNLLQQLEETNNENTRLIDDLQVQKNSFNCKIEKLEYKISEINQLVKSHLTIADNQLNENLKMKHCLQDSSENVTLLNNEITELNNEISRIKNQFDVDMLSVKNENLEKEKTKGDLEIEINRRLNLQLDIDFLKGELQVIDCQQRDELKTLKENCAAELQVKEDEIENKKNELESVYKVKRSKVSELQEEIVDEQKNELQMVKSIQKLSYVHDNNKQKLNRLKNVIKTLDSKLNMIAQAVLKEQSQSTTVSSAMRPPATQKPAVKQPVDDDDDSSSSGISMHGNDTTWKKKLLKKQQLLYTQTATSVSNVSSQQLATARHAQVQGNENYKSYTNKSSEKMMPKNNTVEQSAPARKVKK